jgi:hypothetical protein
MVFSLTGPCIIKGAGLSILGPLTCSANEGVEEATITPRARERVAGTKASAKVVLVNMVKSPA